MIDARYTNKHDSKTIDHGILAREKIQENLDSK